MSSILELWSCGAVEVLKGSWNIFQKILCSVQMYWENCQKFLGCFWKPGSHDATEILHICLRKNWQVHTSPWPETNGWTACFGQTLKTMHPTLYFAFTFIVFCNKQSCINRTPCFLNCFV